MKFFCIEDGIDMKKYWIGAAALLLAAGLTLSGCGNDSGRETGKIHAVTHANWL